MNLVYQIIERNAVDNTMTVRFTTTQVSALLLDPQWENGAAKIRADGMVARCQGDLCILTPSPEPTGADMDKRMKRYAPVAILHAAELALDANATPDIDSVTALQEQSIVLA